jgi:hypothetical protein
VLHFGAGSLWQLGVATVAVIKPVAVDKVLVRHLRDAHTEIVNVGVLRPIPSPTDYEARHVPIDQHSPKVWARAREEERLLGPLLEHSTQQDRARVAKALALSDRQFVASCGATKPFVPSRPFSPSVAAHCAGRLRWIPRSNGSWTSRSEQHSS